LLLFAAVPLFSQIVVDTFAGGKIRSGVPALEVEIADVSGIAWDSAGNVVFSEASTNVIRRIRTDGTIETVAGTGVAGSAGDGGPAAKALLNGPASPRYDAAGNLYFADTANYRIRRIDPGGTITTVAGDGIRFQQGMDSEGPATSRSLGGIADIAVDGAGNVYFSEDGRIRRLAADGRLQVVVGDCGSLACSYAPTLLALDGRGNLFLLEGEQQATAISRISPNGTITTYAGLGCSGLGSSTDRSVALGLCFQGVGFMAADAAGNLYITASAPPHQPPFPGILRIDENGKVTTIAAPGIGMGALDGEGNIAYSDSVFSSGQFRYRVLEFTAQSDVKVLAGDTPKPAPDGMAARDAWLLGPSAIAFNRAGDLYIAEQHACLIRKIGANGNLTTVAGTGNCGTSDVGTPNQTPDLAPPQSIAVDSQNRVYFADINSNVYAVAPDGKIAALTVPPGVFSYFAKLAIDSKDRIYIIDHTSLVRIPPGGQPETIVSRPPMLPGGLPQGYGPTDLTAMGVDPSGNVYFRGGFIATGEDAIFRVNDDGTYTRLYSTTLGYSGSTQYALAVDANGEVWEGSSFTNASGTWALGTYGSWGDGGPAQSAQLSPTWIAFAPNGDLYMADNHRIRKLSGFGPAPTPAIAAGGIVNAASYMSGGIAPGELISIFGSNLGAAGRQISSPENNTLPFALGRTKVWFGGSDYSSDDSGAIVAVTPNQINVFVPQYLQYLIGTSVDVRVQVDTNVSAPVSMPVVDSVPGIFTPDQSGSGQGAILNQDGSVNSRTNPAPRGSMVSLFGTGGSFTVPQVPDGTLVISTPFPLIFEGLAVTIGGQQARVIYAGAAPFLPTGIFQVNAVVPGNVTPGNAAVTVAGSTGVISRAVTVAVQ
jgi:uncharacterized protein (TIGR03437 family)